MTTLGLVRHGVTEWNKIKRTQGHANNPLDQEGITQAQAVPIVWQKKSGMFCILAICYGRGKLQRLS